MGSSDGFRGQGSQVSELGREAFGEAEGALVNPKSMETWIQSKAKKPA